jgi:hypothetical protein
MRIFGNGFGTHRGGDDDGVLSTIETSENPKIILSDYRVWNFFPFSALSFAQQPFLVLAPLKSVCCIAGRAAFKNTHVEIWSGARLHSLSRKKSLALSGRLVEACSRFEGENQHLGWPRHIGGPIGRAQKISQ